MKYLISCVLIFLSISSIAQRDLLSGNLKMGAGYAKDFPGVTGPAIFADYSMPMNEHFEAGFGIKHANMQGYPRTKTTKEFTKVTTLDFNFYALPLNTENSTIRLGVGYSFAFYNIQRTYPVYSTDPAKSVIWPTQQVKSRASGFIASFDYQYHIPNTSYSAGVRVATFKAFDQAVMVGPYFGIDL
jgi:hypothetical protein